MKLAQLRNVLRMTASHYRSDGFSDVADALSTFEANLIKGNDSDAVSKLVNRIVKARKPASKQTAKKRRR